MYFSYVAVVHPIRETLGPERKRVSAFLLRAKPEQRSQVRVEAVVRLDISKIAGNGTVEQGGKHAAAKVQNSLACGTEAVGAVDGHRPAQEVAKPIRNTCG